MFSTIALIALAFGALQADENVQRRILLPPGDAVQSMSPEEAAEKCIDTLQAKERLGAWDLLIGSGACLRADRAVEASFLINVGTIRGAADFAMLIPATKAAAEAQHDLVVTLYYSAGSVGSDEVLRDPDDRKRLAALIESWQPQYSQAYQPGWEVGDYPPSNEYYRFITEAKEGKLSEIRRVAVLVSDDEYYRLHTEYVALLERVSKQEKQDPADLAEIEVLQSAKMRRAAALGDPTALAASSMKEEQTWQVGSSPLEGHHDHPKPALPIVGRIVERPDDPIVKRCARAARHSAVSGGGLVFKSVVVEEPEIGLVYRADLTDDSGGLTRFWCSERFTGSVPITSMPGHELEPLPDKSR